MKQEFERHSSTNDSQDLEDRKKYAKLTPEIKQMFIEKIVFENLSIKQASEMLRINYSSAKAIASGHRRMKPTKTQIRSSVACSFRSLSEEEEGAPVEQICSTIGGLVVSEKILPKRKLISKLIVSRPISIHSLGTSFREVQAHN